MNNFVKQINGVFTVNIDGREHNNLVVNSGLSSTFNSTTITSLCETLKVFDDQTEIVATDTDYPTPSASSSNITSTFYGVSGSATGDYFYMKRTWTFSRGQIEGVIGKLAVYSDDGTLYAAALLKTPEGELDPIRPLFAPKVEITYESRWHFKQGSNFNIGIPVYFSDAGLVMVKSNMASKNDSATYSKMNSPFKIISVELFSDAITTDDTSPLQSLGVVDAEDYTVTYINSFGSYGQKLSLFLPKTKYINDLPIATIVVKTTRGNWQFGFDAPLEKPTLSKREIKINLPFIHGTVDSQGVITPTGNPEAIDSIFTSLLNATYNVSTRALVYDGEGQVLNSIPLYSGVIKQTNAPVTFVMPNAGKVVVAAGTSGAIDTYLDGTVEGVLLEAGLTGGLTGFTDGEAINEASVTFKMGDVVVVTVTGLSIKIENTTTGTSHIVTSSILLDKLIVGVRDVTDGSSIIVY